MRALRTPLFALALAASVAGQADAAPASSLDPAKLLDLDAVICDTTELEARLVRRGL